MTMSFRRRTPGVPLGASEHDALDTNNGPPDTETLSRRRVDQTAGCRTAAEPAIIATRRSEASDN
jgi:hypothetical protein